MKIRIARITALTLYFLLAAIAVSWVFEQDANARLLPFLMATIPLLPWVRGMLHGRPKTHQAVAVVSLLYLTHGSVEAFTNNSPLGWSESIVALCLMFSAAMFARWKMAETG